MIETEQPSICKKVRPTEECDFEKNHKFSKNYSFLPLRCSQFDTKDRHNTDMSSIREKNNRTLRNRQGDPVVCKKNSHVCLFLPIKKPLFSLFLQILPFLAQIQENKKNLLIVSANLIFCTQDLPESMKEKYSNTSFTDRQKKQRCFSLV